MAKEHKGLETLPGKASMRFEDRYADLEQWLNGSVWELEHGVDFQISPESFYQSFKEFLRRSGTEAELGQRGKNIWVKAATNGKR